MGVFFKIVLEGFLVGNTKPAPAIFPARGFYLKNLAFDRDLCAGFNSVNAHDLYSFRPRPPIIVGGRLGLG